MGNIFGTFKNKYKSLSSNPSLPRVSETPGDPEEINQGTLENKCKSISNPSSTMASSISETLGEPEEKNQGDENSEERRFTEQIEAYQKEQRELAEKKRLKRERKQEELSKILMKREEELCEYCNKMEKEAIELSVCHILNDAKLKLLFENPNNPALWDIIKSESSKKYILYISAESSIPCNFYCDKLKISGNGRLAGHIVNCKKHVFLYCDYDANIVCMTEKAPDIIFSEIKTRLNELKFRAKCNPRVTLKIPNYIGGVIKLRIDAEFSTQTM